MFLFVSKVLVTKPDFYNEETRRHLASTVSELISLNIVPIINTNDAVSPPPLADEDLAGVSRRRLFNEGSVSSVKRKGTKDQCLFVVENVVLVCSLCLRFQLEDRILFLKSTSNYLFDQSRLQSNNFDPSRIGNLCN